MKYLPADRQCRQCLAVTAEGANTPSLIWRSPCFRVARTLTSSPVSGYRTACSPSVKFGMDVMHRSICITHLNAAIFVFHLFPLPVTLSVAKLYIFSRVRKRKVLCLLPCYISTFASLHRDSYLRDILVEHVLLHIFEIGRIGLPTFCMQSRHSTTELNPLDHENRPHLENL